MRVHKIHKNSDCGRLKYIFSETGLYVPEILIPSELSGGEKMWFDTDQMLIELHQAKVRLWERSGHNLHQMAEMMKKDSVKK